MVAHRSKQGFLGNSDFIQHIPRADHFLDRPKEMASITPAELDRYHIQFEAFSDEISQIQLHDPEEYETYQHELDALRSNLVVIEDLERNLIRHHLSSGRHLCNLQDWFTKHFETINGWMDFVIDELGYDYTIRTAQREMLLWRNLGPYEDLLIESGRSGQAISTLYLLSNPDKVSGFALEWAMQLIERNVQSVQDSAPVLVKGQPRSETLTKTQAQKVIETANFIEHDVDDHKRDIIKSIVKDNDLFSPSLVRELALQPPDVLEEIESSGYITYPVAVDGVVTERSIPIQEASATDLLLARGEFEDERHKRHLQHRVDNAREKERLSKGIISERVGVVDAPGLDDNEQLTLLQFLSDHPAISRKWGATLRAMIDATGEAGVRSVICKLEYDPAFVSETDEYSVRSL